MRSILMITATTVLTAVGPALSYPLPLSAPVTLKTTPSGPPVEQKIQYYPYWPYEYYRPHPYWGYYERYGYYRAHPYTYYNYYQT